MLGIKIAYMSQTIQLVVEVIAAMRFNWFPWRYLLRRAARAHGFMDPLALLARLSQFSQPSEVLLPLELLREGVVFHARGIINTQVIQQNLDWIWPYWVQRQYNPLDEAFTPRGLSVSNVNLTHRNWTAIGLPGCAALPLVDPRGLVTPYYDGWSIDAWIVAEDAPHLLPAQLSNVTQGVVMNAARWAVRTTSVHASLALEVEAAVHLDHAEPLCCMCLHAEAARPAWLAVVLRPFNPEGVSFVHDVQLDAERQTWCIDGVPAVRFAMPVERHVTSQYEDGDVYGRLLEREENPSVHCKVGMATAAALFRLAPGQMRDLALTVPLSHDKQVSNLLPHGYERANWQEALQQTCRLHIPDAHLQFLYEVATRTLLLHAPHEVYPGPYTYKRFWFRDAAFIVHALLCVGMVAQAETVLDTFPARQTRTGYFQSQNGEWDANGEVLWIWRRFCELTGTPPKQMWRDAVVKGASWLQRKRSATETEHFHAGLLPAGFSAEHLGTNNYYYWDDFWGVAGLQAAAVLCAWWGEDHHAHAFHTEAAHLMRAIERSLQRSAHLRSHLGIPASPYRRMDAGAIGSLVVSYPLCLWPADDPRLLQTVTFLLHQCCIRGVFFQDIFHSGLNAYLTLHMAQVLLRAGDRRFFDLVTAVAALASPTGQWPEAIHPRTGGGCMGDGQHVWAAAEWVLMLRSMFVREEGDSLVLASGVIQEWLTGKQSLHFGPTPTPYGDIRMHIEAGAEAITVTWQALWRRKPRRIVIALPGMQSVCVDDLETSSITFPRGDRRG
jgi:hypothetical protein